MNKYMWSLKEDFALLFRSKQYAPIDGLRAISCIMILTVHVITLLNATMSPYPSNEWMKYLKSYSYQLLNLLSLALETFFMLSGFLLTLKCIEHNYLSDFKRYLTYIFQRACRFWPGLLLVTIVMFVSGEPKSNLKSAWLFYQNYVDMEEWSISFGSLWSVSLDMQVHILLPILLYAIAKVSKKSQTIYLVLYLLIFLSIIYSIFVFDPSTMNLLNVVSQYNLLNLFMKENLIDWIKTRYNFTMVLHPPSVRNLARPFMTRMYLPLMSRYSSFLVGSILAFNMLNYKDSTTVSRVKWKKYFYFTLISTFMIGLVMPVRERTISNIILAIAMAITRQLFTISQAFILFSAICPISHPYHSPWVKSFLSCSIWTPIANLSYLVYVVHLRVGFEFILIIKKIIDFQEYSIDILALTCIIAVFILSLLVATAWSLLVEKSFERIMSRILPNDRIIQKTK